MNLKTALVAIALVAVTSIPAKASDDHIIFPHSDVLLEYVQIEIERGFGFDGDVRQQRTGVEQLKAYLKTRKESLARRGIAHLDDPIADRLAIRVTEIEARLAGTAYE